jgi:membrane-bound ClpP family serine protease
MHNMRLIIAIVTSLLDEALILGLALWGLPKLGIEIPLPITIVVMVLFGIYATVTFKLGSRVLRMKPLIGLTDMVGCEGLVTEELKPSGCIIILGETWVAKSLDGNIPKGTLVTVVKQEKLKLIVKRKL